MIKRIFVTVFFLLSLALFLPFPAFAHPGNTAADGCHYCRTNCDKWGVPWNERHCHNSGSVEAPPQQIYTYPTNTPYVPPPTATSLPTYTPTPTNTPIPTATLTPSPTKAIKKLKQKTVKKQQKKMVAPTVTPAPVLRKNLFQWLFGM